nr:hemicentin-1-like [Misgurnus anguillicaudatus]
MNVCTRGIHKDIFKFKHTRVCYITSFLEYPPDELLVVVDSVLELEFIATGQPPPTLSWLKNGRPLQDSMATIERTGSFSGSTKFGWRMQVCIPSLPLAQQEKMAETIGWAFNVSKPKVDPHF